MKKEMFFSMVYFIHNVMLLSSQFKKKCED